MRLTILLTLGLLLLPRLAAAQEAHESWPGLAVRDYPGDDGTRLEIHYHARPAPARYGPGFRLRLLRSTQPDGPFDTLVTLKLGDTLYLDQNLPAGVPQYYSIRADGDSTFQISSIIQGRPEANWFNFRRVNMLVAILLSAGLILLAIYRAKRHGRTYIRPLAGLEAIDEAVGRATEMGRKILFIPGTQDMDNVQTLAGIALLGRVARLTAQYETPLSVPVSRSLVMVACRETVREAYLSAGRPDGYNDGMVNYITDDQFGYAAALDGIMVRERPATIFLQGSFYAEALILAETGNSIGAVQIAGTAEPSQLPFLFAACDYTLIGEELFVAGAYLSREPRQLGSLKGQDLGKAIILVLLLIGIVVQTIGLFNFSSLFVVQ